MSLTLTIPAREILTDPAADVLATVYVVNWDPTPGVGGFEWRADRADASRFLRDLRDPSARLYVVALPPEVAAGGPDAVTEYLDDEGWSDGIDPRTA